MPLKYELPNKALKQELVEVSTEATALRGSLETTNIPLPDSFPLTAILDVITSLEQLPSGTAEGCRKPLEYARDRLSAERRKHIFNTVMADEIEQTLSPDDAPPLRRGDAIDRAYQALYSAVGVALDEYREQAGEAPKDELATEAAVDIEGSATVQTVIEQSLVVETALQEDQNQARQLLDMDAVEVQIFLSTLRDAEIANRLTRAELEFKTVVRRWYNSLVDNVKKYPKVIRKSAQLLKTGTAVTQVVYNYISNLQSDIGNFGFDQLKKFADACEAFGKELEEKNQRTTQTDVQIPDVDPEIQQAAEEEAVRLLSNNKPVPDDIALNVRDLELSGTDFSDVGLLGNFNWLQGLDVDGDIAGNNSKIEDISALHHLTGLKKLWLRGAKIENISVLQRLSKLTSLDLAYTQVSDIGVLENLAGLQELWLNNTQVSDIGVLENLTGLQELWLEDTPVTDWSPVAHVKKVHGHPKKLGL